MRRRSALLGRDRELRQIEAFLDAARNRRGGALLVTGEPGIGKSTLLAAAAADAPTTTSLRVVGYEAESSIPFAAIDRLLMPLRALVPTLPERHQGALNVAVGKTIGPPPDRFLVGLGVLGLLAAAAESQPVVCAVDDVHLLDRESLEVLAFVGRRLEAESIALLLAGRTGEDLETKAAGIEVVKLDGLPTDAGVKLLASSLEDEIDPVAATQIVRAAGGNPLALIDLAGELTAKQLAERSFAVEPLPIGNHLESHYLRQVRRLPEEVQLWLVIAAADSSGNPELIESAARALDLRGDLADQAEVAGLVELGERVRFRHPLVRSASYNAAHGPQRRRVHAALAASSQALGLIEVEAWHAARATLGTDPAVADRLERVADLAGQRGGFSSRARVLQQASSLTPPGSLRCSRLVTAAEAALAAGAAQLAGGLLDGVDEQELDPVSLGRLIATRASISLFVADPQLTMSCAEMLRAADHFHGNDPDLEQQALVRAFDFILPAERMAGGMTLVQLGRRLQAGVELRDGVAATILRGLSALILLPYREAVPAMRQAVDVIAGLGPDDLLRYGATSVGLTTALWDAEARRNCLGRAAEAARDAGSLQQLDTVLWTLSLAEVHSGSPRRAAAAMEQVRELRRAHGFDAEHVINVSLLAWSGAPIAQVEAIAEAASAMGFDGVRSAGQAALAARDVSEGRYAEAFARLEPLVADPFLQTTPLLLPDFVEAASRSGRSAEAVEKSAQLDAIADANDSPWARGVAWRARALVGEGDAEDAFRQSIAELDGPPVESELARSHLLYGEWLRRNRRRREAREQLETARELFEQIDAPTFATRATAELRALGEPTSTGRPGPTGGSHVELTSQELLVARLAAAGHTNAEIAGTMFLSVNTVDYHLRKVFQKLGISSRRQLRDRVQPR